MRAVQGSAAAAASTCLSSRLTPASSVAFCTPIFSGEPGLTAFSRCLSASGASSCSFAVTGFITLVPTYPPITPAAAPETTSLVRNASTSANHVRLYEHVSENRMTGRDVLQMQLAGSFNILRERLDMISDAEWTARAIPGTNLPGFTLWHAARTIDWGVHCAIQGVPEIADRPEWRDLRAAEFAYGAGITSREADQVAQSISRGQVRGYLDAMQPAALDWLKAQRDGDLERIPEFEAHQDVKPRYRTPPVWAEVSDFVGKPAWQILARPCISHIRVHAGEMDILRQASRVGNPSATS